MRPYLRFLEPLDVLFLRGNRLFGDPGSYGEALVPPWPSVAAGALRSRMLAEAGIDLPRFARGETRHDLLGARDAPGAFTVVAFHLARRAHGGEIEILMPPPADLVVLAGADGARAAIRAMRPTPLAAGLDCSMTLPLLPVLAEGERRKPTSGYWL
ncbi:MAG: type III-B CRISPR module-associated Cmr3 family protein, partial [Acetobacteraceae bacterium]|nr:type III-B CRISPR module-associated Cmr3 family protein [Acetobacteraceae bacterium]